MPNELIRQFVRERRLAFTEQLRSAGLDEKSAGFLRYSARELGGHLILDEDDTDASFDESKLQASFTISTPREDRYGDVIVPRGCLPHIRNFERNPRVFFGHRSFDMPIANSTVPEVTDVGLRATATFHEETVEARNVWRLLLKGYLRATSIGFLPVKASIIGSNRDEDELIEERLKKRKERTEDGEKVLSFEPWMPLRFLEWDLLEWSVVSVPANPDCCEGLTKCLSDGRIEGEVLSPLIARSLQPFALRARVWSHGFDPAKAQFSGVLMLGGEEAEYHEGRLKRLGSFEFPDPETPTNGSPSEVPAAEGESRDLTPAADSDLRPANSDEEEKNGGEEGEDESEDEDCELLTKLLSCLEGLHAELARHHVVEEASQKEDTQLLTRLTFAMEELLSRHDPDAKASPEVPAADPAVPEPDSRWAEVAEAIRLLSEGQKRLNNGLFTLTGEEV